MTDTKCVEQNSVPADLIRAVGGVSQRGATNISH